MKSKIVPFLMIIAIVGGVLLLVGSFYGIIGYYCWQFIQPNSFWGFTLFFIAWTVASWLAMYGIKLLLEVLRKFIPPIDRFLKEMEERRAKKKQNRTETDEQTDN